MTTIQLYYRYFSDDGPYYFDPKDNSTTFQLPIDGIILDPYTLQPVEIDPSLNPEYGLLVDAYNSFVFEQQQAEMREQSKGTKVEVVIRIQTKKMITSLTTGSRMTIQSLPSNQIHSRLKRKRSKKTR